MMLVGGKRSKEYAEHVQNQFSIATSVLPGHSLEDVERVSVLGNVLERVLVLEHAWTVDGLSTNDGEMRRRIGEMTKQARDRQSSEQYVFMALSPESAMMCFEETYDICDRAVVVLYQQKATVVILHELLSTDISALRPILVFNPPVTITEEHYTVSIEVPNDAQNTVQETALERRVIKKTRGAAVQRLAGNSPWYAQQKQIGGNQMSGQSQQSFGVQDMFNTQQNTPMDRGFSDDAPFAPVGAMDMSGQLQHLFKNAENPYAPQMVQPAAMIPVSPAIPASGDMKGYILSKAQKGYSIAFVGPGGSGSTFMALNCAARIYSAGFSVMFIDGDITGHSAQYLTRLGITNDVLAAETGARTLRTGFDMYGASQFKSADGRTWEVPAQVAARYDFIVLDIPFHSISQASRSVSAATRVVLTVESSNWGIGKAALALFNAPVDVAPALRDKGRLVYNRSDKLSSGLFGSQITDESSIKQKVSEVFGARASAFTALQVVSIVGSYASAEEYWFSEKLFSDSVEGASLFDGVLRGVLA